tara:strand:+ start:478 stop:1395 length:918 start_codon:yes stop_codon:yes gene_type:complete
MAYPPITPLPAAPSRNDPDNFSTEADAFVAALPALVTETNAAGVYTADQATAAAADAVLTAADVVSTNADVVSTGDDVTAATAQVALAADEVALATTQANNAAGSATTALGYLSAFEESYIGQYADDAAADASGFTLGDGVFYSKNVAPKGLRVYFDGAWGAAVLDANGALMAANNFSDLGSVATAKTNLVIDVAEASVASAATTDIGAVASDNVLITGTAAITSFGTSAAGVTRKGRFAGSPTLTYDAAALILPSAANILATANSTFEALSLGGGNWIVTSYQRADGASITSTGFGYASLLKFT